ncbi:MAG: hypothetical protein M5R40_09475 [Anaerolineae bacterium]|nr:hypothetical protein [Anaerolineae bacterium]
MTLPRGAHTVALWLDRTPVRAAGEWLSALAVVGVLVLLRRGSAPCRAAVRRRRRWIPAGAAALGVVWLWLRLAPAARRPTAR